MSEHEPEAVGNRLRRLRDRKPWTQAELSRASGVPLQTIKDIERGASKRPRNRTVRALADALQVSASYLLWGLTDSET